MKTVSVRLSVIIIFLFLNGCFMAMSLSFAGVRKIQEGMLPYKLILNESKTGIDLIKTEIDSNGISWNKYNFEQNKEMILLKRGNGTDGDHEKVFAYIKKNKKGLH